MFSVDREELKKEINLCRKLYPDFQAEKMITAVLDAEARFYENNHEAVRPCHYGATVDQIKHKFSDDRSLALNAVELKSVSFKQLFATITDEIADINPELEEAMQEVIDYVTNAFPVVQETTTKEQVFQLKAQTVENTPLKDDLATFLFHFTLSSLFRKTLESLIREVDTSPWRRGDCPICEEKPQYGKLRREDGAKILECWLCGTRWQHTRVQCPGCDSTSQEQMGFFTVEDGKVCRVHFCKDCGGYYKIFDSRQLERKEIIPYVHHLATLSHDLLAAKEGFSPISGLEWINREELSGVETKH